MGVKHFTQPNEQFFSNNRYKIPSENEKRLLSSIFRSGNLSQPEIMKKAGISQQSVSRLVKAFVKQGILYQHHRKATGRPGQPSINVALEPNFAFSLGVIIHVHKVSVILMDLCGGVMTSAEHRIGIVSAENYCYQIVALIEQLLRETDLDKNRLLGIGLGLPGYNASGISGSQSTSEVINNCIPNIANELQNQLSTTVWVESDVTTAALGESLIGTGVKFRQFVYIHVGRQLSSRVIINGLPLFGAYGNSGEIDLLLSQSNSYAPTVTSLYQSMCRNPTQDTTPSPIQLDDFLAHFDDRRTGIADWIDHILPCFSRIVSALAAILDPEAIIIGGELPESVTRKLIASVQLFDDQPRLASRVKPQMLVSSSQYDTSAIGAATIPLRQYFCDEQSVIV